MLMAGYSFLVYLCRRNLVVRAFGWIAFPMVAFALHWNNSCGDCLKDTGFIDLLYQCFVFAVPIVLCMTSDLLAESIQKEFGLLFEGALADLCRIPVRRGRAFGEFPMSVERPNRVNTVSLPSISVLSEEDRNARRESQRRRQKAVRRRGLTKTTMIRRAFMLYQDTDNSPVDLPQGVSADVVVVVVSVPEPATSSEVNSQCTVLGLPELGAPAITDSKNTVVEEPSWQGEDDEVLVGAAHDASSDVEVVFDEVSLVDSSCGPIQSFETLLQPEAVVGATVAASSDASIVSTGETLEGAPYGAETILPVETMVSAVETEVVEAAADRCETFVEEHPVFGGQPATSPEVQSWMSGVESLGESSEDPVVDVATFMDIDGAESPLQDAMDLDVQEQEGSEVAGDASGQLVDQALEAVLMETGDTPCYMLSPASQFSVLATPVSIDEAESYGVPLGDAEEAELVNGLNRLTLNEDLMQGVDFVCSMLPEVLVTFADWQSLCEQMAAMSLETLGEDDVKFELASAPADSLCRGQQGQQQDLVVEIEMEDAITFAPSAEDVHVGAAIPKALRFEYQAPVAADLPSGWSRPVLNSSVEKSTSTTVVDTLPAVSTTTTTTTTTTTATASEPSSDSSTHRLEFDFSLNSAQANQGGRQTNRALLFEAGVPGGPSNYLTGRAEASFFDPSTIGARPKIAPRGRLAGRSQEEVANLHAEVPLPAFRTQEQVLQERDDAETAFLLERAMAEEEEEDHGADQSEAARRDEESASSDENEDALAYLERHASELGEEIREAAAEGRADAELASAEEADPEPSSTVRVDNAQASGDSEETDAKDKGKGKEPAVETEADAEIQLPPFNPPAPGTLHPEPSPGPSATPASVFSQRSESQVNEEDNGKTDEDPAQTSGGAKSNVPVRRPKKTDNPLVNRRARDQRWRQFAGRGSPSSSGSAVGTSTNPSQTAPRQQPDSEGRETVTVMSNRQALELLRQRPPPSDAS